MKILQYIVDYVKLIGKQITHMRPWAYMLWFFGLGFQLSILVTTPITALSVITFLGTILGLGCVIAISNARAINGLLGLISAFCFIYTAFKAKNFLTIGEQVAYILTLDIPVLCSLKWNKGMTSKIRTLGVRGWIMAIASTIAVWFVGMKLVAPIDPRPSSDAMVFAISLVAGILCFLRYNNNFVWWLAVGIFQVILWGLSFTQGDASIAMLISSLMYLANDFFALTISPWFNRKVHDIVVKQDKRVFDK